MAEAEALRLPARLTSSVRLRRLALALGVVGMAYPYLHGVYPLDLHVYLSGGHAVLDGRYLYAPRVAVQGYGFTYPPFAALPFALLAAGPLWLAKLVTVAVFYAALAAVVHLCAPELLRRPGATHTGTVLLALILAGQPSWATLHDGQVNMVLAALVLGDLLRPPGSRARGGLVGIAVAVKLTPAVFVLYLLAARQFAAARNAVLSFLAVTGATWLMLRHESRQYWTHLVFEANRVGDVGRYSNQSLLGTSLRQTPNQTIGHGLWAYAEVAVAAGALWAAVRLTRRGDTVLALGVVGVLSCLLSPVSWTHHWVWFIPALCGLVRSDLWQSPAARRYFAAAAAILLIGCNRLGPVYRVPGIHLVFGSGYVITALVGLVMLLLYLTKRPAPAPAPQPHAVRPGRA